MLLGRKGVRRVPVQVRAVGTEEFQKLKTMLNVMRRDCGRPTSPGGRGRGRGRGHERMNDEQGEWDAGVSSPSQQSHCRWSSM